RRGWLAALVPFASSNHPPPTSSAIGAIAMKKLIALGVLLLLLLGGGIGLLWRHHSARDEADTAGTSTAPHQRGSGGEHDSPERMTSLPEWIPQSGAPPRRIAGHVVFRGQPVGGARVTLGFQVSGEVGPMRTTTADGPVMGLLQRMAEVRSATDGSFDFGVQP